MSSNNWGGKRDGAGRKKTGRKTVSITLTLSPEQAEELKSRARHNLQTPSKYVVDTLKLDDHEELFDSFLMVAEHPSSYDPYK